MLSFNCGGLETYFVSCLGLSASIFAMVRSTNREKARDDLSPQEVHYAGIVCGEYRIELQKKGKKYQEKFSQKNVAELVGLSAYNLSRYESGSIRMPLKAVVAVAKVLSIDPIKVYEEAKERALRDLPAQIQALAKNGLKKKSDFNIS